MKLYAPTTATRDPFLMEMLMSLSVWYDLLLILVARDSKLLELLLLLLLLRSL
jgi:hypothetical protein